jgi:hypothetical protein
MSVIARVTLTKIHMLLAAFMFPVAFMFLLTGALYTWGVKGSYDSQVYDLQLSQPLASDQQSLLALTEAELQRQGITVPSGKAKLKTSGTSFQLEWTGSNRDVVLEPTADELLARLTVKDTSWYRHFVQLHKAKGAQLFKYYAAGLAIALFVILLSGFMMAWQVPKYRKLSGLCGIAGLFVFVLMVTSS